MMVLEGLVTTINDDGSIQIRPMGPLVEGRDFDEFTIRPYRTSTTYRNLKARGEGVLHVIDDPLLLARATLGDTEGIETFPAEAVRGHVLRDACRWCEFRVRSLDDADERTTIAAEVVHRGTLREFFGLNRALHAVVEAAILATRTHLIPPDRIAEQIRELAILVDKTGGPREHEAFDLIRRAIRERTPSATG
jgi:hypothetical protein